ncbi:SRPBCC family protein [Oligoflexus tunisiensis]|uniref:SRPBCC family protein n=1 Tax=Oligoflexus tunisiensis TaxID=708132 RepID=UPI000AFB338F|nr:SRPBCC family protein [Oligoflexus tunisiensis]
MNQETGKRPTSRSGMLIRKPVREVYDAFIDPLITTRFWFTRSSGSLEAGQYREWFWDMYDLKVPVWVRNIEPNQKIVLDWGEGRERNTVEWIFQDLGAKGTFVHINSYGFQGTPEEISDQVADTTGGFHLVLAGLKAWLEHGIQLNLVADRFPKEIQSES